MRLLLMGFFLYSNDDYCLQKLFSDDLARVIYGMNFTNSFIWAFVKNILLKLLVLAFERYVDPVLKTKLKILYNILMAKVKRHLLVVMSLWIDEHGRYLPKVRRLFFEVGALSGMLLLCSYAFFGGVDNSLNVLPITVTPSPTPFFVFDSPVATPTPTPAIDDDDDDDDIYFPIHYEGGF